MSVFVLAKNKKPLMPCSERRARILLGRGRARVHRMYPFTIRLVGRVEGVTQPLQLKLDPGSKHTGVAIVRVYDDKVGVVSLIELKHRGGLIKKRLEQRSNYRRGRRSRNLRYRAPRFNNRPKPGGWLAPSLQHRVDTTVATVNRLRRWAPITSIVQELVKFDTQKMQNPEISGVEYQQGELLGYEVREYLLEKWNHSCAYCDKKDVPLNIDHVHPKSRGGSNLVSNLVLACVPCNQKKNAQAVEGFLAKDPTRLAKIKHQLKTPLKDAAMMNATRWALYRALSETGLPVTTGTGAQTKYNRGRFGIPKTHVLDAVCAGDMGEVESVEGWGQPTLMITANGRGQYCRTRTDASGFPCGYCMRTKSVKGFTTGDMVTATVLKGKNKGTHFGRVAIRARGSFDITTSAGRVSDVSYKCCRVIQRGDGYNYQQVRLGSG